jgi:hypothetical protein
MLRSDTAQVGVHIGQGDYAGCYLMEFGGAPIVSLPIGEIESYRAAIVQWQAGIVRMPALVEAVFGKRVVASRGSDATERFEASTFNYATQYQKQKTIHFPNV